MLKNVVVKGVALVIYNATFSYSGSYLLQE